MNRYDISYKEYLELQNRHNGNLADMLCEVMYMEEYTRIIGNKERQRIWRLIEEFVSMDIVIEYMKQQGYYPDDKNNLFINKMDAPGVLKYI